MIMITAAESPIINRPSSAITTLWRALESLAASCYFSLRSGKVSRAHKTSRFYDMYKIFPNVSFTRDNSALGFKCKSFLAVGLQQDFSSGTVTEDV